MKNTPSLPVFFILLFIVLSTSAYTQIIWNVKKLNGSIKFDGIPDEPAWQQIPLFPFIVQQPSYGGIPEQKTDVRLTYDDNYIYLGASLYYHEEGMIRAVGKVRDFQSMFCDWLGIQIDTYNDNQNAVMFFTNPNGVRYDGTIFNDGTPGEKNPMDINWNAFWEVKTVVKDKVWYTEMKIPISSLRFESINDVTKMGLNISRYVAATNEIYIFPDTPFNWGGYSDSKPSTYADGIFPGLQPRKPLYVSPYILTGFEQTNKPDEVTGNYEYQQRIPIEPGLDVKYGLNSNTTLDLTVNTDFAQVEADQQQFNLSRFSLVFPEKRKFFLERADVFEFCTGGPNQLFYSRRIGLYNGEPVRILGGARLMSCKNGWDFGFMDIQTGKFNSLPSENFVVARVKKKVLNENSYAGGMLTSRIGVDGRYNLNIGADAVVRIIEDEYITIRWAQTFDDEPQEGTSFIDRAGIFVSWMRRKENGLTYSLLHKRSGLDYNPGIGLQVFKDYHATTGQLRYTFIPDEKSVFQSHVSGLVTYMLNDIRDNSMLTYYLAPGWSFTTKTGWNGAFNLEYNIEVLHENFQITEDVFVLDGKYNFSDLNLSLATPGNKAFKLSSNLIMGQYYDGLRFSPTLNPTWNISNGVELGASYVFDHLNFSERTMILNNHIAGVRGLYMISTTLSLSGFIQYNTAINKVISNVRFRYNPKEGTDLYLVFNEGRNTYLERELSNLPTYSDRNVMLKFTYTFDL